MTEGRSEGPDRRPPESDSGAPPRQQSRQRSPNSPSVFAEPWMQQESQASGPPQAGSGDTGPPRPVPGDQPEDQFVYDEPALSEELIGGIPDDGRTWFRWYQQQAARAGRSTAWLVTMLVVLFGGVMAVVGTLIAGSMSGLPLLNVVVFGPTTEELMKVAVILWIAEKRPWLFRHPVQILLCALASGAAFAAVENVLYLTVYIAHPSPALIRWRWTVCVILHTGCSLVAGMGVVRIWTRFQSQQRPPVLADGAAWIVTAIVLHGLYNGTVTLLEKTVLEF